MIAASRNDAGEAWEGEGSEMVRSSVSASRGSWLGAEGCVGLAALFGLLLGGCADVSFKAGATPGEIQRDELACHESSSDDETYASCMKERGYLLSKAGDGIDWTPATR